MIDAVKPLQSATTSLMWLSRTLRFGGGDWLLFAAQAISVLFPLLQLCPAWWLWRNASVVASWSLGHALHDDRAEPAQLPRRANLEEVESIVVAALGLWLLISSVPQIVSQTLGFLVAYVTSSRPALDAGAMVVDENIWIWAIQFVIGLWLIFGAGGITRMLRRARGAPIIEQAHGQPSSGSIGDGASAEHKGTDSCPATNSTSFVGISFHRRATRTPLAASLRRCKIQ